MAGEQRLTPVRAAELARTGEPAALLLALARAMDRATVEALDDPDDTTLTLTQLRALRVLMAAPRSVGELADALGSHRSSTSRLASRLSRSGLVRRGAAADDGRAVRVEITDAGRDRCRRASARRRAGLQRQILDQLPPHRLETVVSCLRQVVLALDDGGPLDEEVWLAPER